MADGTRTRRSASYGLTAVIKNGRLLVQARVLRHIPGNSHFLRFIPKTSFGRLNRRYARTLLARPSSSWVPKLDWASKPHRKTHRLDESRRVGFYAAAQREVRLRCEVGVCVAEQGLLCSLKNTVKPYKKRLDLETQTSRSSTSRELQMRSSAMTHR